MPLNERLIAKWKVKGHSTVVWYWSGDPMVPRSNPLLVRKFLLLSLLIWKGGFEILPNNTWDLLKKAYGTSKKLRFQFRCQLKKRFSEPTYLYTNLTAHYKVYQHFRSKFWLRKCTPDNTRWRIFGRFGFRWHKETLQTYKETILLGIKY